MAKNNTITGMSSKVPFIRGFEENGMIEAVKGKYSVMYELSNVKVTDTGLFQTKMEAMFSSLPLDFEYQFIVHNALIPKEDYLKTVLIPPERMAQTNEYNHTILDNSDIGHNNVKKKVYFVVSCKASIPEQAIEKFQKLDTVLKTAFGEVKLKSLDLLQRLEIIYEAFHPGVGNFAEVLDLDGSGKKLSNLKYLKMTTKDLVAPKLWTIRNIDIDSTHLNEGYEGESYTRTLFLNGIPKEISTNVINDLTSVSSNMLLSMILLPVNSQAGFQEASEAVQQNTLITKKQKRESIQDKKNKTVLTLSQRKISDETAYFNEAAEKVLKLSVASSGIVMEAYITITLYADSMEELDRNTELLKISATKFACSVKTLDLYQYEGFCTTLPLCNPKVNVARFLDTQKLAELCPVSSAEIAKSGGAFVGLNSINDNLVFLSRKVSGNISGAIIGAEKSGKTYQTKREILNAMLTTNDKINLIAVNDEYDDFIRELGGTISHIPTVNPFYMTEGYGLIDDAKKLKKIFLMSMLSNAAEVDAFLNEEIDFNNLSEVLQTLTEKSEQYPEISELMMRLNASLSGTKAAEGRLHLYKASSNEDIIVIMDALWNGMIEAKKSNITSWIFIDNVDAFFQSEAKAKYLSKYLNMASAFRTIVTVIIQDAVGIIADISPCIALEMFVKSLGYIKLLNLGPIERKKLVETLNIPNALIPYISNVEPSKGLILTSASSVPFDDNFLERGNAFTEIFLK